MNLAVEKHTLKFPTLTSASEHQLVTASGPRPQEVLCASGPETHSIRNVAGVGAALARLESQRPRPAATNQMRPQTATSPTYGLGPQHTTPPSYPEVLDPENKG